MIRYSYIMDADKNPKLVLESDIKLNSGGLSIEFTIDDFNRMVKAANSLGVEPKSVIILFDRIVLSDGTVRLII